MKCKTSKLSRQLHARLQDSVSLRFPEPLIKVNKFELSPLTEAVIEARFLGPDPAVLDSLVGQAIEIMRQNPKFRMPGTNGGICRWLSVRYMIR